MIKVAVCDNDAAERRRLRNAVERYAKETKVNNIDVVQFATVESAANLAARMRPDYFDIVFCRIDVTGDGEAVDIPPAVEAAMKLREEQPDVRLVFVSADTTQAIYAYNHDAGFLPIEGAYDDFVRAASEPLADAARKDSAVLAVKTSNGVQNVALADVQFVESSKRGPIIHLPAGKTAPVRGTLQTLFENLTANGLAADEGEGDDAAKPAADKRFVKAGSSFIVNLDNVRGAGEGSLIFADGETIIVPVRKRKAVLDALQSYWVR